MNTRKSKRLIYHVIWLVCLLAGIGYFYAQGKVVSDISQFMPQASTDKQLNILLSEIQQGAASRYLLIRVQGKDEQVSAQLSRELKQHLQKSPLFSRVQNGEQEFQFKEYSKLYPYRYLLMPATGFTSPELRKALQNRLTELRSGMGLLLKQTLTSDPQNRFIHYLSQLADRGQPQRHLGVWFDRQLQGAMLLVALAGEGFDLNQQQQAINMIKAYVASLPQAHAAKLEISGPATMAVATRAAIQSSMHYLGVVSGGLMLVLFLWAYRSLRHLVVAGLPLASAILAALVVTNILFGQVHGIVIAFGITLLGVCLDLPLHLFSHLKQGEAPTQTLHAIWPTLRLSVITTALSYVALLGTGFLGLSQLAVFAMTGLTTALLVTRWIVPYWLSNAGEQRRLPVIRIVSLRHSARSKYALILAGSALPVLVLLMNWNHLWSRDIASLSPIPAAARQLDQRLRTQMAVPGADHSFFVTAATAEEVLQKVEALKPTLVEAQAQGLFKHVLTVSDILPSAKRQRQRQQQLPDSATLRSALMQAMAGLPFRKASFDDFLQAVVHSKGLKPLTWQDMQQTPLAAAVKQNMFVHDGQWVSLLRVSGIPDEARFAAWLRARPALAAQYLNMRTASSALMLTYQQTALVRLLIGIIIIAAMVGLMMRSAKKMLRVVLPIVLAVLLTISLQVLMGTALTLFHILSLLLVVGMGLDYSLFFNRPLSDVQDLNMRTHGVMMSAASTLAAFGVLAFAGIPVLAAMGQTVSIGVLCCYVLSQWLAEPEHELAPVQQDRTTV